MLFHLLLHSGDDGTDEGVLPVAGGGVGTLKLCRRVIGATILAERRAVGGRTIS